MGITQIREFPIGEFLNWGSSKSAEALSLEACRGNPLSKGTPNPQSLGRGLPLPYPSPVALARRVAAPPEIPGPLFSSFFATKKIIQKWILQKSTIFRFLPHSGRLLMPFLVILGCQRGPPEDIFACFLNACFALDFFTFFDKKIQKTKK